MNMNPLATKYAVVTGTLGSGVGFTYASYPEGFNQDNCVVVSPMYKMGTEWRTGDGLGGSGTRTFTLLGTTQVQIYNDAGGLFNSDYKIALMRID